MKHFSSFLMACGVIIILLSVLLLRYNEPDSAAYLLSLADIVIGFIMLASGGIYQLVKRNRQK